MKAKFKSVKTELPNSGKLVWITHLRTKTVEMGYYTTRMNAFFDMDGEGIAVTHWADIEKPEQPTREELIHN